MIIANERGRGIYLLAHLHAGTEAHIRRGMRIEPGDVVAFVGRSGSNTSGTNRREDWHDPHLHLEYYDIQYDPNDDNGIHDDNNYVRVTGTHGTENVLALQQLLTREGGYRRNPFVHSEQHP